MTEVALTPADMTFTQRFSTAADWLLSFRFLVGYINACKLINAAKGKWTPEMIRIQAKWSGLAPEVIAAIPTPPYVGEYGRIHVESLEQVQRFWHTMGLVNTEQAIDTLVDTSLITAAQKVAGVPAR